MSGGLIPTREAVMAAAGIAPVTLAEKEGLALINGTDGMLGMLLLAIIDLRRLLKVADIPASMSVEGCSAPTMSSPARICTLSDRIRVSCFSRQSARIMAGSEIRESHRTEACTRVQDAYSLRRRSTGGWCRAGHS